MNSLFRQPSPRAAGGYCLSIEWFRCCGFFSIFNAVIHGAHIHDRFAGAAASILAEVNDDEDDTRDSLAPSLGKKAMDLA